MVLEITPAISSVAGVVSSTALRWSFLSCAGANVGARLTFPFLLYACSRCKRKNQATARGNESVPPQRSAPAQDRHTHSRPGWLTICSTVLQASAFEAHRAATSREPGAAMDTLSPSAEQAAQRKEELEELAAGINKLAEHQQELADRLQQDQQHVAETQKEVAEQTVESQHILDTLRPQPEGESVS